MANGAEVARAYVTIVPTMQGAQAEITKELTGITDSASKSAGDSGGSSFGTNFASAIKGTAAAITAALVAATTAAVGSAVAAGKAFIDAAKDTAAYGDMVDKTSQRLGISRSAFQELDYVLNLAGTSMESMSAGFRTLTNRIDEARGGSEDALGYFNQLGISMEDLSTMSTEDIFKSVITGFQDMGDTAERAALAQDVLGRSGQQLAPLFNMTSDATREAIETANEYGMILSDDGVAASAQFTDSMTTMEKTVQGLKNNMMANFLPAMSGIMDGISQIFAGDKGGADLIRQGITDLISQITTYAPLFFELAQTIIDALIDGFTPMIPDAVLAIFSFLTQVLTRITGMASQLTPVIQQGIQMLLTVVMRCLPLITSSLLELITGIVAWLGNGTTVNELLTGILQLVSQIADQLAEVLPVLLPAIINIIAQIADAITEPETLTMLIESVLYIIGAIVMALVESLPEIGRLFVELFKNIAQLFVNSYNDAKSKLAAAWNTIKEWCANLKNTVVSWISGVISSFVGFFNNLKEKVAGIFKHIGDSIGTIKTKVTTLVSNIISVISSLPERVVSIGKNLITGLWNGISDKVEWIKSKIQSMGSTITKAIKKVFGIASPSKLWRDEVGSMLAQGIGVGFTDEMDQVKDDMADSMNDLTYSMTGEVSAVSADSGILGNTSNYTGGTININVYGAEGQDVNSLADIIAQKLEDMTRRKESVYA